MKAESFLKNTLGKFVVFLLLVTGFIFVSRFFHLDRTLIQEQLASFPLVLSGIIFVLVYVATSTVFWLGPKDILRLAAVFVFGPYISTVFITAAEMLNLPIMFSLSRRLGRPFVAQKLQGGMKKVDLAISQKGYGTIFFLRLLLLIPLRFLDLGFGLTQIALWKYFLISLLATPIRIFVVQFFWSLGIETVTNPERLAQYLIDHPQVMTGVLFYLVGSVVMLFVLKRQVPPNAGRIL